MFSLSSAASAVHSQRVRARRQAARPTAMAAAAAGKAVRFVKYQVQQTCACGFSLKWLDGEQIL